MIRAEWQSEGVVMAMPQLFAIQKYQISNSSGCVYTNQDAYLSL